MKQTQKIPATNEVVAALLAKRYVGDKALLAAVKSDPAKALNMRDSALRVRTVQNTRDVLHVCVPDYSAMQELESSELDHVSGGAAFAAGTDGMVHLPRAASSLVGSFLGNRDGLTGISAAPSP